MAAPTITSISPSYGPSSGFNLVKISGTNFRLYTIPSYGPGSNPPPVYVQVLFGGIAAGKVFVYASNYLEAEVPAYSGDPDVATFDPISITVKNLDDSLVPIPGETVTVASAYTYKRDALLPPTTDDVPHVKVTRSLIHLCKRNVLVDFGSEVHTDFSADGIKLQKSGIPSLTIMGPDVIPDAYGYDNENIEVLQQDGSYLNYTQPIMHTFIYELLGYSDSKIEYLTLMAAARKIVWRNPYLVVAADLPAGAELKMPMVMTREPASTTGIGNANLKGFSATIEVRRVPVVYLPANNRTWPVSTIRLDVQKLNGTLVETLSL